MVTHVFTKFKEAGKKPVNYFKFVLNPDCFGTSIENMFHVSFLVKEGKPYPVRPTSPYAEKQVCRS